MIAKIKHLYLLLAIALAGVYPGVQGETRIIIISVLATVIVLSETFLTGIKERGMKGELEYIIKYLEDEKT